MRIAKLCQHFFKSTDLAFSVLTFSETRLLLLLTWNLYINSFYTGNDRYSGDRYSGNDRYSGLKPPDDAILLTVSGITAIADKKFEDFDKNDYFST